MLESLNQNNQMARISAEIATGYQRLQSLMQIGESRQAQVVSVVAQTPRAAPPAAERQARTPAGAEPARSDSSRIPSQSLNSGTGPQSHAAATLYRVQLQVGNQLLELLTQTPLKAGSEITLTRGEGRTLQITPAPVQQPTTAPQSPSGENSLQALLQTRGGAVEARIVSSVPLQTTASPNAPTPAAQALAQPVQTPTNLQPPQARGTQIPPPQQAGSQAPAPQTTRSQTQSQLSPTPQAPIPQAPSSQPAGQQAQGAPAPAPQTAGPQTAPPQSPAPQAPNPQAASRQPAGQQAQGAPAPTPQAAGPQTAPPQSPAPQAPNPQATSRQPAGQQAQSAPAPTPQAAGPQTAPPQSPAPQASNPQATTVQSAGQQVQGAPAPAPQAAGPQTPPPQSPAPQAPNPQATSGQAAGQQDQPTAQTVTQQPPAPQAPSQQTQTPIQKSQTSAQQPATQQIPGSQPATPPAARPGPETASTTARPVSGSDSAASRPETQAPPSPPAGQTLRGAKAMALLKALGTANPAPKAPSSQSGSSGPQRVTLEVAGRTFEVHSPRPIPPGTSVKVSLEGDGQVRLHLPSPRALAVAEALRQHLPQQQPPQELFNLVQQLQSLPALNRSEPLLMSLVTLLLGRRLGSPQEVDGKQVRKQVQDSGVLMEQKASRPGQSQLAGDQKALLMRIAQQLPQLARGGVIPQALTQKLEAATRQAISRVITNQIHSLTGGRQDGDTETGRLLVVDLPVQAAPHKHENIRLLIREQSAEERKKPPEQRRWQVELHFSIEGLPAMSAVLTLHQDQATLLWKGERGLRQLLNPALKRLDGQFARHGLSLNTLGVREQVSAADRWPDGARIDLEG